MSMVTLIELDGLHRLFLLEKPILVPMHFQNVEDGTKGEQLISNLWSFELHTGKTISSDSHFHFPKFIYLLDEPDGREVISGCLSEYKKQMPDFSKPSFQNCNRHKKTAHQECWLDRLALCLRIISG